VIFWCDYGAMGALRLAFDGDFWGQNRHASVLVIGLDGLVQLHWCDKDGNDDIRRIFVFMTEMTKLHSS
jgi:hypothetical protein